MFHIADIKIMFFRTEIYSENVSIVEPVLPPEKKYKCMTCGVGFNCPKERRVHRTKEHSAISTEKKVFKKKSVAPLKTTIKVEKTQEPEPEPEPEPDTPVPIKTVPIVTEMDFASNAMVGPEFVNCSDVKPPLASIKVELEKKKPDLVCGTCKVEFPDNIHFTDHLKIHPLECLTCGKFFNRRPNLQLHLKRHFGIKDYKYVVSILLIRLYLENSRRLSVVVADRLMAHMMYFYFLHIYCIF